MSEGVDVKETTIDVKELKAQMFDILCMQASLDFRMKDLEKKKQEILVILNKQTGGETQ